MQLRHIRPGSLEWQDAKSEEAERWGERLTPEEIIHLRQLAAARPDGQNHKGQLQPQASM